MQVYSHHMNTTKTKRSTANGVEQTVLPPEGAAVPSYVCLPGVSIDAGAASLGLRVLGRRETGAIVAEIHERGGQSYWCVKA